MGIRLNAFTRNLSKFFFGHSVARISDLSLELDEKLKGGDPSPGVRWLLSHFVADFSAHGAHHIPSQGPLLIIANHPASYDALLISAFVHRPDYKIIIGKIPIYDYLPNVSRHAIFAPPKTDANGRMTTLRRSLRHLRDGGALLIFPRGDIEPDPALEVQPALVMDGWSRSLEIFLRQVPNLQVVIAMVSGVIAPQAFRHPFTWFKREQADRANGTKSIRTKNQQRNKNETKTFLICFQNLTFLSPYRRGIRALFVDGWRKKYSLLPFSFTQAVNVSLLVKSYPRFLRRYFLLLKSA